MSPSQNTPIELLASLPEVLKQLNINPEELFGSMTAEQRSGLESLHNLRTNKPVPPKRPHTQFAIFTDGLSSLLPDLKEVSDHLSKVCKTRMPGNAETTIYNKDRTVATFNKQDWLDYSRRLSTGNLLEQRVFNMMSNDIVKPIIARRWRKAIKTKLKDTDFGPLAGKLTCKSHNTAITPPSILTHIHADSRLEVTTVTGGLKPDLPVKIWILWPSTELHHLTDCLGNTKEAFELLDHGSFYVQMNGESLLIPSNSPHAVYTVQTCYLYSSVVDMSPKQPTLDPCPTHLKLMLEPSLSELEACEARLHELSKALSSSDARARRAHVQDFLSFWGTEASIFRKPGKAALLEELAGIWAEDIRATESCVWCTKAGYHDEKIGRMLGGLSGEDYKEHARRHLAFGAVREGQKDCGAAVVEKGGEETEPVKIERMCGHKRKAEVAKAQKPQKRSRRCKAEPKN